jgi:hypothetical protein
MSLAKNQADAFNLGHIGWKYYNTIRKKAVEQEFSWSGLIISLSIAFFVVAASASALSFINHTIEFQKQNQEILNKKIHLLEINTYLSEDFYKNIAKDAQTKIAINAALTRII